MDLTKAFASRCSLCRERQFSDDRDERRSIIRKIRDLYLPCGRGAFVSPLTRQTATMCNY